MPPEPGSAADWIRHARSDLALAKVERPADALLEALCFHAQQAAEKAIKAVLVRHDVEAPRTHSIRALLDLLPSQVDAPPTVVEAAELTEYAVQLRYPGAGEPVEEDEYARAVELAETVVRWAQEIIDASPVDSLSS